MKVPEPTALFDDVIQQIDNAFTYHAPRSPEEIAFYKMFREQCRQIAYLVVLNTKNCRERSLALTNLEQVVMWTNAGVARHGMKEVAHARAEAGTLECEPEGSDGEAGDQRDGD